MTVADAKGRRWDAATGIGFAIFTAVAFAIPGTPPKADDPIAKIATFFTDHRKDILVGNFLLGIGALLFIWFVGTLRSYLRSGEGGEGRLSAAAFGGGVAGIALLLVGAGVLNAVALQPAKGPPAAPPVARAALDAPNAFLAVAALRFGAFLAPAAG